MIKNIKDLETVLDKEISKLMNISPTYLSDAGKAALEAYKAVNWHVGFHDTMESLSNDEQFMDLVNIGGKHSEYYRVLRMVNRAIQNNLN